MTNKEPDYATMSLADLLEIERHINRDLVPERWARLRTAIAARRPGTATAERPVVAAQPIGPVLFTMMHMIVTVILLVIALLAFPGQGGESAVGSGLALFLVVPAAFFISGWAVLFHRLFLRARRPGLFLMLSLLITPVASAAVLVIGSSILFSLSTFFSG